MKKIHYILIFLFFISCKNNDTITKKILDEFASQQSIPAWAYVSWQNGKIKHYFYDGFTFSNDSIEINEDTYFEAASLSKTVFAALVLDYFKQNALSLDSALIIKGKREISKLEFDRRIKTSKDYAYLLKRLNHIQKEQITARKILTHTAGFGDWMSPQLHLNKSGYYYSGEGFLYLQRWIEEYENKQIDSIDGFTFMNNRDMDFSLESTKRNTVWGHDLNLKACRPIWYSDYPYVHGTLCCKPKAFAEWWLDYLKSPDSLLLTSQFEGENIIQRSAGLGILNVKSYELLWQHGNDTYFQNFFVHDKNSNSGFVVFTNSQNGFNFINEILGERFTEATIAVNSEGLCLISE